MTVDFDPYIIGKCFKEDRMKKKICAICLLFFIFLWLGCSPKVKPILKDEIQYITVANAGLCGGVCDDAQEESFVKAYNSARLYRNDVGTTQLLCVDVMFTDGTQLFVWGDSTQGFLTMAKIDAQGECVEQHNLKSAKLEEWFLVISMGDLC